MKNQQVCSSTLPPKFAEEVLDLEGELAMSCQLETVHRLIQLYTIAIEHYEALEDIKHLHYQSRLRGLLTNPEVLACLNCPPRRVTHGLRELSADRSAQQELDEHKLRSSSTSRQATHNLQRQSTSLDKRLEKRQRHQQTAPEGPRLDKYEQHIEEVMEWFAEEKARVVQEIEDKYERELEDLSDLEGYSLLDSVIEAVKTRMLDEISRACTTLEGEKKAKVQAVRTHSLRG